MPENSDEFCVCAQPTLKASQTFSGAPFTVCTTCGDEYKPVETGQVARAYTCPDNTEGSDIRGCGSTFVAKPDAEGLVDCPECGIWFSV